MAGMSLARSRKRKAASIAEAKRDLQSQREGSEQKKDEGEAGGVCRGHITQDLEETDFLLPIIVPSLLTG